MTPWQVPPVPGATTGERCDTCLTLLPPQQVNGKPAACILCGETPRGES